MSYSIQIEPLTKTKMNNNKSTETKRQSFYTRIRYASKLLKLRTEIRKHRTLPNDFVMIPSTTTAKNGSNYCYEDDKEVDTVTLYDEKDVMLTTTNKNYSLRRDSQLALPSRLKYVVTNINNRMDEQPQQQHDHIIDNNQDEEEEEMEKQGDTEYDDDSEDDEDLDNYVMDNSSYSSTLQKLSGITFGGKKNTAVLITLSPCALAAANAARQKRQKIRISH